MKYLLTLIFLIFTSNVYAGEKTPSCSGIENWATSIAYATLKNNSLVNSETIDYPKTVTTLISSAKIGNDLYKQVHHVTFINKSGGTVQVITVNDASSTECSMSGVEVYVISKKL